MKPQMTPEAARARALARGWRPRNCVWELTLACNLRCAHCGSVAGKARRDELSLEACLDIVDQLAEMGCELITLSGGEPTMKRGWDTIARAIHERGIYVNMVTNGAYRDQAHAEEIAGRARAAGMSNVGVSIDGPRVVHDLIRAPGSFDRSMAGIEAFIAEGMSVAVMTTVNRLNVDLLEETRQIAIDAGASMWRLQLAKAMGNQSHEDLISLDEFKALVPQLAALKRGGEIHLAVGDSIGYYGVHDRALRGWGWRGRSERWGGCQAGMQAIGIEADGGVKGCLSLQAKQGQHDPFIEGSLREERLADLWFKPGVFAYNRDFEGVTGVCAGCKHAEDCRGGARCVSSALNGLLTEDPYCYHGLTQRPARRGRLRQGALAAALVMAAGCDLESEAQTQEMGVDDVAAEAPRDAAIYDDAGLSMDYGQVEPDEGVMTDYGVPPQFDAAPVDRGVAPDAVMTDYGMPPQLDAAPVDRGVAPDAVMTDYGMPPQL
ncbi:radical SAM protein, partial [Myxococcota bacterium]|nr:radical SAM protein [Myxococcota bacterium]